MCRSRLYHRKVGDQINHYRFLFLLRCVFAVLRDANVSSELEAKMPPWPAPGLVHLSLTTDGQTYSSNPKPLFQGSKILQRTALSTFIQGQHSYAEPSRYVFSDCDNDDDEIIRGLEPGLAAATTSVNASDSAMAPSTGEDGQYFRYIDVHKVESVCPTLAPLNSKVVLTILGRGFTDIGSLRVRFCGPSEDEIVPATLDRALEQISVHVPLLRRPGSYSVSVSLSADDGFDEDGWTAPQEIVFYTRPVSLALVQACVPELVASSLIIGGKGLGLALRGDDWTPSVPNDAEKSTAAQLSSSTAPMHAYVRFIYQENKANKEIIVRGICVSEPPPRDVVLMNIHSEKRFRMTHEWDSYIFCKTPKLSHPGKVEVSVSYNKEHWHKCAGRLTVYTPPVVLGACLVKRKIRSKSGYARTAAGKRVTVSTSFEYAHW